jgi:Rhodopirellula transposase DDE domain
MRWKKKDPDILAVLEELVKEDTAGDPSSSRKWKRPSLRCLAAQLGKSHHASPPTVARLLRSLDYSPKVNRKMLGTQSPERDAQFKHLNRQKRLFLRNGWPVISVDTKKRELIGCFKNPGQAWCREAFAVNVYDYPSLAEGIGIPYGIYDLARNEGFVVVGTSANTAEFSVAAVSWWWRTYGRYHYPETPAMLILADGGSSNGCRVRLWKHTLQRRLVNPTGLQVSVCHYPPGASKWNPVEHRLLGPIAKNWQGYPLFSYERLLRCIRGTETKQGLKVHATLDQTTYATKKKISDAEMKEVNLYSHRVFPRWNYTLKPA